MPVQRRVKHSRGTFAPTRLTAAREVNGFTKKALADLLNVAAASITQYELYVYEPLEETVEQFALILGFPVKFFYGKELNLVAPEAVTFRSRHSMTAKLKAKATNYSNLAVDIVSPSLMSKFRLPEADVPDLSAYRSAPDQAASILRAQWRIGQGPVANTVHLLESKGVEVYWVNEESSSVSAFSRWNDSKPFIFLNSHSPSGDRGRFDAVHELAHLVLHKDVKDLDSRDVEPEADAFAAAFLLPADQFRSESPRFPLLERYFPLKHRWGVSIAAMVRRSRDVGMISQWQYECACKEISMKGWRTKEPHLLLREQSQVHEFVMKSFSDKGITPENFAESLQLQLRIVETLMPVSTKYHEKAVYPEDMYSLSLLRVVDRSIRSQNMGLDNGND